MKVHDVIHKADLIFFVTDLCQNEGNSLHKVLENPHQNFGERGALDIFKRIIDALDYIHNTLKSAHLNIRPENIFLNQGEVKVVLSGFRESQMFKEDKQGTTRFKTLDQLSNKPEDETKIDVW